MKKMTILGTGIVGKTFAFLVATLGAINSGAFNIKIVS